MGIHDQNDLELVFHVTQPAWEHLIDCGGGSVINTASIAGLSTARGTHSVPHAAAKGGVLGFTRALAAEGALHGIRVNAIAPGIIDTQAIRDNLKAEMIEEMTRKVPLGHIGRPEDIAYFALYLASDESSFVTASTFTIDGGSTIIR